MLLVYVVVLRLLEVVSQWGEFNPIDIAVHVGSGSWYDLPVFLFLPLSVTTCAVVICEELTIPCLFSKFKFIILYVYSVFSLATIAFDASHSTWIVF